MSHRSGIQLVCFDLGGVLVRLCNGFEHACELAGVQIDGGAAFGEADNGAIEGRLVELSNQHESGRIDDRTFDDKVAKLVGMSLEAVDAVARAWLVEPYPDIDQLLDALEPTIAATACLSNTNHRHWQMMSGRVANPAAVPVHRLDHHFVSHEIGAMKPDPRIYEYVEQTTHLPPAAILFFDDKPENIEAARSRGWQGCRIDPAGHTVEQMKNHLQQLGVIPAT